MSPLIYSVVARRDPRYVQWVLSDSLPPRPPHITLSQAGCDVGFEALFI